MSKSVSSVPEGYHSVTPYLIIEGASKALDYYVKAFAATEVMRMPGPGGRIGRNASRSPLRSTTFSSNPAG